MTEPTIMNGDSLEGAKQFARILVGLFPKDVIERVLSENDQNPHSAQITKHPGGAIEIHVDQETLVLTEPEYLTARRRGESVQRNRRRIGKKKEGGCSLCPHQNMTNDQSPVLLNR
jgi:hypothetical protein